MNELLEGKKQSEVANNYGITQGAVSQKWGDFQNELDGENLYGFERLVFF